MYTEVFIKDFTQLGRIIGSYLNDGIKIDCIDEAVKLSCENNPLFTRYMQVSSLKAIVSSFLDEKALRGWTSEYSEIIFEKEFEVMIVMAGNIPMVGFHDLLTVLASGRIATVKLSGGDRYLIPAICDTLYGINSYWRERIKFREDLADSPKMVIATGGDETAAYFRSRYSTIPSVIRGAKYSVALLKGDENDELIEKLAIDIFLYFGMGCRSVSTLLVPENYDLKILIEKMSAFSYITNSDHYRDAYRYQKAISSVSGEWFLDGGFFIFKKNCSSPPPLGVVGIIEYSNEKEVEDYIATNTQSLQCTVNIKYGNLFQRFGTTQFPTLSDYADGVNTLEFILKNS